MKNFPWGTVIVLFILYYLWQGGFFNFLFSGVIPGANTGASSTATLGGVAWWVSPTCSSTNQAGCPVGYTVGGVRVH